MIKMLHLADLHIGVENYGQLDPESGLHSRLNDYLRCLDQAIAVGLEERVDVVLIAGDIYKTRSPNPTHQREFATRVRRILRAGVPVVILTGNHDISPAAGRAHSVEIFEALAVDGVLVADRLKLHTIATPAGPLQLVAVPWVTRHALLSREELRLASFAEVDAELRRRLDRFIAQKAAQLDPEVPAVVAFHGTVDGATLGAERSLTLGQDLSLPRSSLALPEFAYVALGHIHRHQVLGEEPPVVYPGSIERIDFGEREEQKGCVLVELEPRRARWRFVPLDARPMVSIEVDVRPSSDPQGRIEAAIRRHRLEGAIVRVRAEATREQAAAINEAHIRQLLRDGGAAFVAGVSVEVERAGRRRFVASEDQLAGLTPRRALELYLQQKGLPPERIAALLAAADELLAEARAEST